MALGFFLMREAVVLVATAIAAATDIQSGEIKDWLTFPLLGAGMLLALLEPNSLQILVLGGFVFAAGYLLYVMGKIGGGDVKLFTGMALVVPFVNGMPFILPALLYAALLSAVFWGVYYTLKYARAGIDWKLNRQNVLQAGVLGIAVLAYFWFMITSRLMPVLALAVLGVPLLCSLLFMAFEKGIKKSFFLKHVKLGALEEDEVLAQEFAEEKIRKILQGKGIMEAQDIARLKKMGVAGVPVYRNFPKFGPFIFLGCALAFWQPTLLGAVFFQLPL